MKKQYCIITVLVLCVATFLLATQFSSRLPDNAKLVEERDGVRLYNVNVPQPDSIDGVERAYITDGGKKLAVLNILHDWVASLILVTDSEAIVLSDSSTYPGKSGMLYSINRSDGSVAYIPSKGLYFFTAPDDSYAAFGASGGTVELTSFGTDVSRTFSLNGDFQIGAMTLSPDEKRILVLSDDINRRSDAIVHAVVFLIDIEKDAQSQLATQVATFEETLQEGPFVPFIAESAIVWDSNIQATITDDDGQTHIISVPALD